MNERHHKELSQSVIETPFGTALIQANDAEHIYMDANGSGHNFEVNRVKIRCSAHFALVTVPGISKPVWRHHKMGGFHAPYLYTSRVDFGLYVSDSARTKLIEQLPAVIGKWAEDNPDALAEGQRVHLNNEIMRQSEKVREATEALTALKDELGILKRAEKKLPKVF